MKKLLLGLGTAAAIVIPITSVVACGDIDMGTMNLPYSATSSKTEAQVELAAISLPSVTSRAEAFETMGIVPQSESNEKFISADYDRIKHIFTVKTRKTDGVDMICNDIYTITGFAPDHKWGIRTLHVKMPTKRGHFEQTMSGSIGQTKNGLLKLFQDLIKQEKDNFPPAIKTLNQEADYQASQILNKGVSKNDVLKIMGGIIQNTFDALYESADVTQTVTITYKALDGEEHKGTSIVKYDSTLGLDTIKGYETLNYDSVFKIINKIREVQGKIYSEAFYNLFDAIKNNEAVVAWYNDVKEYKDIKDIGDKLKQIDAFDTDKGIINLGMSHDEVCNLFLKYFDAFMKFS